MKREGEFHIFTQEQSLEHPALDPTSVSDQFKSELVSWAAARDLSRRLAGKIAEAGLRPDIIVAVARGGYVPARMLCDYLDIKDLSSIQIVHYTAGAEKKRQARLVESPARDMEGMHVLLVDDVNDTGDTLELARSHFAEAGVRSFRIAVLDHKSGSSLMPDFYARKVINWRWIIYPWAVYEDVNGFLGRMEKKPGSATEARNMLKEHYGLEISEKLIKEILAAQER